MLNSENPNVFISILITLYINRQQAINSKSINNISSGGDADLTIFYFFLAGARVKEVRGGALRYPDRMSFGEKWANFNVVVDMDRN